MVPETGNPAALMRLATALQKRFSAEEAGNLSVLLGCGCRSPSIVYEEISLEPSVKDDTILLAYEERLLLPLKSIRGSAWEDRILNYSAGERYHMLPVVQLLVRYAQETGLWDPDRAISEALAAVGERAIPEVLRLLAELYSLPPQGLEAGVMQALCARLGIEMDLHDTIDHCVRCGIMSPRTQRSLHTGLAKYEMNPSLRWRS